MEKVFSEKDLEFLQKRGMNLQNVEQQIKNFENGFPYVQLTEPATTRKGITQIRQKKMDELVTVFQDYSAENEIVKFVPASGAASRMFKQLFEFRNNYRGTNEDQLEMLKDKGPDSVYYFFEHLNEFGFFNDLLDAIEERGLDYDQIIKESRYERILNTLLTDKGLSYGSLPKALIPFHVYSDNEVRTAMAEHLAEGARYARSVGNVCRLHFTVSPEHMELMKKHLEELRDDYEDRFQIRYEVDFSIQDPSTDVITVDLNNVPVRNEEGELVFRPGGHGALLKNLNELKEPVVIIKNIDNVCHDRLKDDTYFYKMVLTGYLVELQDKVHSYLKGLHHSTAPSTKVVDSIWSFMEHKLCIVPPEGSGSWNKDAKIDFLKEKLNRPIRVCGMVENEGEPGGGPFWVKSSDGSLTLQIIESSQIDFEDESQVAIQQKSTHFNPVDIVCGLNDYQGTKFELTKFTDPQTGFISIKSMNGTEVKAQELPGLWNGSMANWITIFVEVPLSTFNPVKIVNDLLREQHTEFG